MKINEVTGSMQNVMLDWLQKNHEWVFDGIGVAAILAVAGAVAALVRLLFVMRKISSQPKEIKDEQETRLKEIQPLSYMPPIEQKGESYKGHVVNIVGHTGPVTVGDIHHSESTTTPPDSAGRRIPPAPTPPRQASKVAATQIQDDIRSAPPFQKDERAKHYEGLPIDWECLFSSVTKRDDGVVAVALDCKKTGVLFCHCKVLLSDYPELRVLPADTPVRITGVVEKAESHHITVKDAILYF